MSADRGLDVNGHLDARDCVAAEAEVDALKAERDMWRQQYERERVRVGYVLGWLPPGSFNGDESKQHEYIAHMDTAAGVRSRIDSLRADLRDARDALGDAE